VLPVQRFHWDSAEYVEAFATLVRCAGERVYERQILREICAAYPTEAHAIDWGAGGGDLTSLLMEHFQQVYAVEPHPGMRAVLATRCPRVQILFMQRLALRLFSPSGDSPCMSAPGGAGYGHNAAGSGGSYALLPDGCTGAWGARGDATRATRAPSQGAEDERAGAETGAAADGPLRSLPPALHSARGPGPA
jgi:hypothetical protein